jgi:hypothetical protein
VPFQRLNMRAVQFAFVAQRALGGVQQAADVPPPGVNAVLWRRARDGAPDTGQPFLPRRQLPSH